MSITVKPSQLRDLLAKMIPAREPLLIVGAPGIGKTDIVFQAAAMCSAHVVLMHPVVSDPTDFKGLPAVLNGDAHFLPFGELKELINATTLTIAFMDDLGQATPAVQAAAMQLILARRVNGHKISDHVVFVAATNRRQDRAGVQGILEPVKSRFTIVELAADATDWRAWAASNGIEPEVIAFIAFRPQWLSDFKPSADIANSPCPRNWGAVSRNIKLGLPKSLELPTTVGRIGPDVAPEFIAFRRIWQQMVSPDVVFAAPDKAPIPTEDSALWALATACADKVRLPSMGRFCKYLERLLAAQKREFAAVGIKVALARDPTLASSPDFVVAAAGPLGQLLIGA